MKCLALQGITQEERISDADIITEILKTTWY